MQKGLPHTHMPHGSGSATVEPHAEAAGLQTGTIIFSGRKQT
jgi:hypothetical protein